MPTFRRKQKLAPKSKPRDRVISHEVLRRMMSELISLREQVAQAELAVNDLITGPAPTFAAPNEDLCATD
jgi:hypothetical protein